MNDISRLLGGFVQFLLHKTISFPRDYERSFYITSIVIVEELLGVKEYCQAPLAPFMILLRRPLMSNFTTLNKITAKIRSAISEGDVD